VTVLEAKKTHACSFVVPSDHPALPGHFPGHAVVPGVVIVDRVVDAAEDWLGHSLRLARLPQAKFVAPLYPGERADVTLTLTGDALAYAVHRDGELLGRGTLILHSRSAS
jgi:3-hydroxyacyl-[acyl-carrier-protein] dehydratase